MATKQIPNPHFISSHTTVFANNQEPFHKVKARQYEKVYLCKISTVYNDLLHATDICFRKVILNSEKLSKTKCINH